MTRMKGLMNEFSRIETKRMLKKNFNILYWVISIRDESVI